jgi:hypothetical protein
LELDCALLAQVDDHDSEDDDRSEADQKFFDVSIEHGWHWWSGRAYTLHKQKDRPKGE